jgi:hypothetical protein
MDLNPNSQKYPPISERFYMITMTYILLYFPVAVCAKVRGKVVDLSTVGNLLMSMRHTPGISG